eukprot:1157710-Pelagomonas_calceolata.AAC.9
MHKHSVMLCCGAPCATERHTLGWSCAQLVMHSDLLLSCTWLLGHAVRHFVMHLASRSCSPSFCRALSRSSTQLVPSCSQSLCVIHAAGHALSWSTLKPADTLEQRSKAVRSLTPQALYILLAGYLCCRKLGNAGDGDAEEEVVCCWLTEPEIVALGGAPQLAEFIERAQALHFVPTKGSVDVLIGGPPCQGGPNLRSQRDRLVCAHNAVAHGMMWKPANEDTVLVLGCHSREGPVSLCPWNLSPLEDPSLIQPVAAPPSVLYSIGCWPYPKILTAASLGLLFSPCFIAVRPPNWTMPCLRLRSSWFALSCWPRVLHYLTNQRLSGLNRNAKRTDILDDPKNRLIKVYYEMVDWFQPSFTLTEQELLPLYMPREQAGGYRVEPAGVAMGKGCPPSCSKSRQEESM